MDSAPLLFSPSSDKQIWNTIQDRVDEILQTKRQAQCNEFEERFREDSKMLMRGFESISSSLVQLSNNLCAAQQGVSDLAKPCLAKIRQRDGEKIEEEPKAKRPRGVDEFSCKDDEDATEKIQGNASQDEHNELQSSDDSPHQQDKRMSPTVLQSGTLKKAKNLAASMATKASFLARELKSIKADLCFMQDRCNLLEEENKRLREGFEKGARPEEDDLVRLQLEALLAEKSRLANENANLIRENQCLHQLVEYHQLTALDLSSSYDQFIHGGTCLDFSSPSRKAEIEFDSDETFCTPLQG